MTFIAMTIGLIAMAFLNGLHVDACGCQHHRHHRAESDRIGPYGRPDEWPNDGPGVHDRPKNYHEMDDDEDDYFIGAR